MSTDLHDGSGRLASLADVLGLHVNERAALLRHAENELTAGRHEDAIETLHVAVTLDPCAEEAWRALANAYRISGRERRAEAIEEALERGFEEVCP